MTGLGGRGGKKRVGAAVDNGSVVPADDDVSNDGDDGLMDFPCQVSAARMIKKCRESTLHALCIDFGVSYVTVQRTRTIVITNVSNLPAHFKWGEANSKERAGHYT